MLKTTGNLIYLLSVKLPPGTLSAYSPAICLSDLVSLMTLAWTQRSFAAIFKGLRLVTVLPTVTIMGEQICVCLSCLVALSCEYTASDHPMSTYALAITTTLSTPLTYILQAALAELSVLLLSDK